MKLIKITPKPKLSSSSIFYDAPRIVVFLHTNPRSHQSGLIVKQLDNLEDKQHHLREVASNCFVYINNLNYKKGES